MSKRKEIEELRFENARLRNEADNLRECLKREYFDDPKPFIKKKIFNRLDDYFYGLNRGRVDKQGFFELLKLLIEIDRIDFSDISTLPADESQKELKK